VSEGTIGMRSACTGIVLAGGRSERFGRDKLAEPIAGGTLLDAAVAAVAAVTSEVVVVVAPDGERSRGERSLGERSLGDASRIRLTHDPVAFGGPLVGLLAGLEAAGEPLALVVGGDMPGLRPAVLALMVATLAETPEADAVALQDGGRIRPLPLAVRVGRATGAALAARARGARSLHALLDGLRVEGLREPTWRALDPGGDTLRDIDRPSDLGTAPD